MTQLPVPLDRFLATLTIVAREIQHLEWSRSRLFAQPITAEVATTLGKNPELAERIEAFAARFGRLQDTLGEKALPRWLVVLAERPGSMIDTLNRAERLGLLDSADAWIEARQLRNRLVHEYMTDGASFAEDLNLANTYCRLFFNTYQRLRIDAMERLSIAPAQLPPDLPPLFTSPIDPSQQ